MTQQTQETGETETTVKLTYAQLGLIAGHLLKDWSYMDPIDRRMTKEFLDSNMDPGLVFDLLEIHKVSTIDYEGRKYAQRRPWRCYYR